jgi:RNA polymerase sigma factor (sigma-70 family)
VVLRTQPDERLVAMARDGGRPAFDEIVRRHRSALSAFAGSLAPASRAEDVVQESLLKAFIALQQGAEPELLRAWLFRIVRNTAIDEQRGTRLHEELDENYDGVEQPPQAVERRAELAALMLAIQDLPTAQRQAIVQRELEGRGHEEIGRALDLSPGSVRQLIYRARHTLREAAGALIPAAMIRVATIPGADEAAGGLGAAAVVKVGLATVVATGTIVAGSSIQRHDGSGTAEAVQIATPSHGSRAASDGASSGDPRPVAHRGDGSGSSNSGQGSARSGDGASVGSSGHSGDGGSGGHSGSGDDSVSSGSGSSGSGSSDGVSGSGSSGDGGGGGETLSGDSGDGGSGTSGSSGDLFDSLQTTSSGPG